MAQGSYGSSSSDQGTQTSNTSGQTTVRGCLNGSTGNYTLTDQNGKTYTVQGDDALLSKHVGHTIAATGTVTDNSQSTGNVSSGNSNSSTLQLTKLKHISGSCTKSNMGQ
jgi:hypothetical protein